MVRWCCLLLGTLCGLLLDGTNSISLEKIPAQSYGAKVLDYNVAAAITSNDIVSDLTNALDMHSLLIFPDQNISQMEQIEFASLFGELYLQSSDINRNESSLEEDPRIAIFSNDPSYGIVNVGVEGYHVDGNVAPVPHKITMIYCVQPVLDGDTYFIPLDQIVQNMPGGSERFANIYFRSAHVPENVHPLIYPHPSTGKDTMMFGLGSLSGQYIERVKGRDREMTMDETASVMADIEKTIEFLGPYAHQWSKGDLVIIDNLALAHKASPGTQSTSNGVRIMRRVNVRGSQPPAKRPKWTSLPHICDEHICLVSLWKHVNYTSIGKFHSRENARRMCRYTLHPQADLASLQNQYKQNLAQILVERTRQPHWINADEWEGNITWIGIQKDESTCSVNSSQLSSPSSNNRDSNFRHPWDQDSGQPNDCSGPGSEPCVFIGPYGRWFDFACQPKAPPDTPGPEITWSDGIRRMYNVHPLCEVPKHLI